jgi:putative endonuclease
MSMKLVNIKDLQKKYNCHYLIYYEHFTHIEYAIDREKEIKKWRREKKDLLISLFNPDWSFLNEEIVNL